MSICHKPAERGRDPGVRLGAVPLAEQMQVSHQQNTWVMELGSLEDGLHLSLARGCSVGAENHAVHLSGNTHTHLITTPVISGHQTIKYQNIRPLDI